MSTDRTHALADQVRQAAAARRALRIVGGDSKAFYGRRVVAEPLAMAEHSGIVAYDATELVITARAGTRLADVERELSGRGQMLGFEPPRLSTASTIGGVVAAGLAGPRRPFNGAVRDSVLGVKVLDGRGGVQRFGGVVFKNVAGFDAFRLMAGSLGCLAVLLEVSLRVIPAPRVELALVLEMRRDRIAAYLADLLRRPHAVSGAAFDGERLHLRLSGGEAAVREGMRSLGGENESLAYWEALRDLRAPFFERGSALWRIAVPAMARSLPIEGDWLWDWAGAQRWLSSGAPAETIRSLTAEVGGHATLFRGESPLGEVFTPLSPPLFALHRRLKAAFDPAGIFNPGRMYADL